MKPKTIEQLRNAKKRKTLFIGLISLLFLIGTELCMYQLLYITKLASPEYFRYAYWIAVFIAVAITAFVVREIPYSLEEVTIKKGRWYIQRQLAQLQELLNNHPELENEYEKIGKEFNANIRANKK